MTTAIVFGASGLVGAHIVQCLLLNPAFDKVIVVTRKPLNLKSPKIEQRICHDLFNVTFEKVDSVFCAIGTTLAKAGSKEAFYRIDYDLALSIATICKQQGCRYFGLVSAVGSNANSPVFYSRTKGQLEKSVSLLGIPSVLFVRPSLLSGHRQETRLGEQLGIALSKCINPLLLGPLAKYRPVQAQAVAQCLIDESLRAKPEIRLMEWSQQNEFIAK